jgi:predicted DNA binding CopG/RHH family protein
MKQELLENFIRIRVTNADRAFIEQHISQSGLSISDLFRELIHELKNSSYRSTTK